MKKFILYSVLAAGLLVSACSNFLDVEPETLASGDTYYRTPEQAYRALVGCYDGLQSVWADGVSLPVASEVLSDNTFGGTGATDGLGYQALDEFDQLRSPSDQNLFNANWIAYYKAVYRCNVLIGKMDQIEWGTDASLRPLYESEARFLRAYLYFDMVRLWGHIPLLTEPSTDNVAQTSADEVYRVIAEDLTYAIGNMPEVTYAKQPVTEHGRVTKWAAEALLGRVYLYYTGYYPGKTDLAGVVTKAKALEYLEDCIAKSGHALVDDFAKLWPAASVAEYAGEDNIETVFAIKYTYTSNYAGDTDGNHWMVLLGIRDQFAYPYGNGWGGSTVTKSLWDAYSTTDTRRVASIISVADEGISVPTEGQREYTGYYGKKYIPMVDEDGKSIAVENGAVNFMIGQFQDYVSIRYSDVLLMAAELGSANAQTYFDAVRERAYQDDFVSTPVTQASLMEERRLEFALEGIRYWDLLRQGIEVAANEIATSVTVKNGGVDTQKQIVLDNVRKTNGLQQIPNTQITLSDNLLKQNDGW